MECVADSRRKSLEDTMFSAEILAVPTVCTTAVLLVLAVWYETRTKKIPNWLSVLGLIAGFVLSATDQLFLPHAYGFLLGFLFDVAFFVSGIGGGGAAKLMMATGSVIGPAAPIASSAVSLLIVGYAYVSYKLQSAPEMRYEGEETRPGTTKGSLIIALGTAIGIVVLGRPWE